MEHKISLGDNRFVGVGERFMAGEETILSFESADYALDEVYATITNGSVTTRHALKDAKFDITDYCKKAGVLEIRVDLIAMGAIAKSWILEPFVVRENGGEYIMIPEIALLRAEVRRMKTALIELQKKINDTM